MLVAWKYTRPTIPFNGNLNFWICGCSQTSKLYLMTFVLFSDVCSVAWVVNCEFCGFRLTKFGTNLNKKCWFDLLSCSWLSRAQTDSRAETPPASWVSFVYLITAFWSLFSVICDKTWWRLFTRPSFKNFYSKGARIIVDLSLQT